MKQDPPETPEDHDIFPPKIDVVSLERRSYSKLHESASKLNALDYL